MCYGNVKGLEDTINKLLVKYTAWSVVQVCDGVDDSGVESDRLTPSLGFTSAPPRCAVDV